MDKIKYKGYTEKQLISMACDLAELISGEINAELDLCYIKKGDLPDMEKIKKISKLFSDIYCHIHGSRLSHSCSGVHNKWRDRLIDMWDSVHKNGGC